MRSVVLTDGGMGQELVRRSQTPPTPLWSARVMLDEPDLVRGLHEEFIRAGAKVITLNTYSATPERLAAQGIPEMFEPLQKRGVELALAARDAAGDCAIAGCLPPLFGSYAPRLTISYDETLDLYRRVVAAQADSVDLFLCETMASADEARAAVTAAAEAGKPVWVSWTLADAEGGAPTLRSGETIAEAARALGDLPIAARLVNCCRPETVDAAFAELKALGGPIGAYANGFTDVSALKHGGTVAVLHARHDLSPEAYAEFGLGWAEKGASIIGGCCEVGPEHIAALRDRLAGAGYTIRGAFDA